MTRTIEVSDEMYEKIKKQQEDDMKCIDSFDKLVGEKLFIRTVTYHLVGEVVKVIEGSVLRLKNASWVADSGRFSEAIKNGTLSEVEVVGTAFVNMDSVTDFFPWKHELPTESK